MTSPEDQKQGHGKNQKEMDLIDIISILGEEKKLVLGIPILCISLALLAGFITKPTYTAKTVLLPPSQQGGGAAAAIMDQLGPMAGLAGSIAGIKSSCEMYVAFLKGDTIRNELTDRYKLQERYHAKFRADARSQIEQHVKITCDKVSGLIIIEVEDQDPVFSAKLANAHPTVLSNLLGHLAISEAHHRRAFFEREVDRVADKAYRDIRVQEAVLAGLLKQLELARIEESKEGPLLQQVDIAQPPERKSGPKRALMVVLSGIFGGLLGLSAAFISRPLRQFIKAAKKDGSFEKLREAWAET